MAFGSSEIAVVTVGIEIRETFAIPLLRFSSVGHLHAADHLFRTTSCVNVLLIATDSEGYPFSVLF